MNAPDIEVLHFSRSYEGKELLSPEIRRELPQFSDEDLVSHGFELLYRVR